MAPTASSRVVDGGTSVGPAPGAAAAGEPGFAGLPPVSCRPELSSAVAAAPERQTVCAIDVGSRNVKLLVASVAAHGPLRLLDERSCRSRLQLGDKTFDQATQTARDLPAGALDDLAALMRGYQTICQRDGGRIVGAFATEWARRASNPSEIVAAVTTKVGLPLQILPSEEEGKLGYLAATEGARDHIVLDFGSRSFQISYWARGADAPVAVSLPLGIDETGERFFAKGASFAEARSAFAAAVENKLHAAIAVMAHARKAGKLQADLYSLGENGDMALAVDGQLFSNDGTLVSEADYGRLINAFANQAATARAASGSTPTLATARVLGLVADLDRNQKLYDELRTSPLRKVYGNKVLAFPALIEYLAAHLGIDRVVLVPHDLAAGFVVERIARAP